MCSRLRISAVCYRLQISAVFSSLQITVQSISVCRSHGSSSKYSDHSIMHPSLQITVQCIAVCRTQCSVSQVCRLQCSVSQFAVSASAKFSSFGDHSKCQVIQFFWSQPVPVLPVCSPQPVFPLLLIAASVLLLCTYFMALSQCLKKCRVVRRCIQFLVWMMWAAEGPHTQIWTQYEPGEKCSKGHHWFRG